MPDKPSSAVSEESPKFEALYDGELELGHATIACAVLESGDRVLTQETFLESIGRAAKAKGGQGSSHGEVPFLAARNLKPYTTDEAWEMAGDIIFRTTQNQVAYGYRAELLPLVCDVYLKARRNNDLHPAQEHIAEQCEVLVRSLAKVGIVALVDEATGYQQERRQKALQKIFDQYLTEEKAKWAKTFKNEFYRQIFRLRGWEIEDIHERPSCVGRYTNDIVYDRLAPGILENLQEMNPTNENDNRSARHHQYLTSDARQELVSHIDGVTALMKASSNWKGFKRLLERAYPKQDKEQLDLFAKEMNIS